MAQSTSKAPGRVEAKNEAVAVPSTGNTTLIEIEVDTVNEVGFAILPVTNALDAFLVQGKFHREGAFVTLYSAAGAFTSPAGLIVAASGDLTGLAAAATGWFIMDVRPLFAVRLQASAAAAGASAVSTFAQGRGYPNGA